MDTPKGFNSSKNEDWNKLFMDKYAPQYEKYEQKQGKPAPASAVKCTTEKELNAWHHAAEKQLKEYVPKAFQKYPLLSLQRQYDGNLKRIQAAKKETKEEDAASTTAPAKDDDDASAPTDSDDDKTSAGDDDVEDSTAASDDVADAAKDIPAKDIQLAGKTTSSLNS